MKKLIFAPLFLILFALLVYQLNPLFESYDFIFNLSWETFIQLIILTILIFLTSLTFILFATLANNWKFILPSSLVAAFLPMLMVDPSLGLILGIGSFASILIVYLTLENSLKTYLTFQPNSILGPSIRNLSGLLILVICFTYFLSISKILNQTTFEIPDSLIEQSLKLIPQTESQSQDQSETPQISIPEEQIELLKQNPDLLKQYGLSPEILDSLSPKTGKAPKAPEDLTQDLIKQTVKESLQKIIEPYQGIVPIILAIVLFLTFHSLISLIYLLNFPLLWMLFYTLEKIGFIKFTVETRSVKKMVI